MQWAWQNDSIRTSNDNLPAVRSLPKSITEGENKLKVVMASGVLSQAINLSFVNTLVRRKKKNLVLVLNFDHLQATDPDSSDSGASPCR